jgi:hypothetical protein
MKMSVRLLLASAACLVFITPVVARKPAPQPAITVAGVYENFTVGKGSGDLEGMRVVIVPAADGYYAIVQIAQGGAEDPKPEFVPIQVRGKTVSFTVGDAKYGGAVSASALTVRDSSGQSQVLKRKACSAYFK